MTKKTNITTKITKWNPKTGQSVLESNKVGSNLAMGKEQLKEEETAEDCLKSSCSLTVDTRGI